APFPADPGPAGHADDAVHDEDPAMISVVDPIEGEGTQRPVVLHAAPGLGHRVAMLGGHGERPHGVEKYVDLDAGAAAFRERLANLLGRLAILEDVLGVVDASPGAADNRELRREDLLAVEQNVDTVAADDRGSRIAAERRR